MSLIRCWVGLLLVAALVLPAARSEAADIVKYPIVGLPPIVDAIDLRAEIVKPAGPGPFPAVIVLHDCAGITDRDRKWGAILNSWGYVAIFPDSFGSRGKKNLCQNVEAVNASVRVQDVIGTAEYLATLPYVQKGKIAVLGFSHGGWTIMRGVQENSYWPSYGIKGAVAYYPFCIPANDNNRIVVPLRILIGANDDLTPPSRCMDMVNALKKVDVDVDVVTYPNTYHSFDGNAPLQWITGQGAGGKIDKHRIGGNPEAAKQAEQETKQFLHYLLH